VVHAAVDAALHFPRRSCHDETRRIIPGTSWASEASSAGSVPAALPPQQAETALHEIGVDAEEVLELGGWKTSENVAVVRVPFAEET
jgi:hypothetical protein